MREVGLGIGRAVDLGAEAVRLELLDHGLEPGVRGLHLKQRLHRVEPRRRAHPAGLGRGEARRLAGRHLRRRPRDLPRRGSCLRAARARRPEAAGERHQMQRRLGGAAALVLAGGIGADRGLRVALHRQDAVADAEPVQPEQHQPARRIVADRLVMRGLAADHAAERDVAVEFARPAGEPDRRRQLERPRHLDGLLRRPGRGDGGGSAGEQRIGDVAVEGRDRDQHPRRPLEARRRQRAVALMDRHPQAPGLGIGRVPAIDSP